MDETLQASQAEAPAPGLGQGEQAVKEGDASKASALGAVSQTRENLGHVGVSHEVHADESGNLSLTLAHVQEDREYRALHNGKIQ